jgi:hypothetical protein
MASIIGSQAFALQEVAGVIEVSIAPGSSSSFQWGLISDSDQPSVVQLRAEGAGSEFITMPSSVALDPGKLHWVNVTVSIPGYHPGSVKLQPNLFATELGKEGGMTVINIQVLKRVQLQILANPEQPAAKALEVGLTDFSQNILLGDKQIKLSVMSSGQISAFEFDPDSKALSFSYAGNSDDEIIYIAANSILDGPYNVSTDGKSQAYEESVSEGTNAGMIAIKPQKGTHDIVIMGTRVVPEFPFSLILVALPVVLSIAAARGRRSLN